MPMITLQYMQGYNNCKIRDTWDQILRDAQHPKPLTEVSGN